jgi:hypothetical protein
MPKLNIDWRFTLVHYELWALEEHLRLLEEQIDYAQKQIPLRTNEWLQETGHADDPVESEVARRDAWEVSHEILPRHLRNSFLVLLWASVELSLREVARALAREVKTPLTMDDLRGKDFLDLTKRYFRNVLARELPTQGTEWQKLVFLYALRNSIAHSNGRLSRTRESDRKQVEAWTERFPELDKGDGVLRVSSQLVEELHGAATGWIGHLVYELEEEGRARRIQSGNGT